MLRFEKYRSHGFKTAHTHYKKGEDVTRQGLAYTPADMERLTSQGLPVTSQEVAARFYDGDQSTDFNIPSDRIRGNDINDLWEQDKTIRAKAKKAYYASKQAKQEPKKD